MTRVSILAVLALWAIAHEADAAGRTSRFATLQSVLSDPFNVGDYSQLSIGSFGLPEFEQAEEPEEAETNESDEVTVTGESDAEVSVVTEAVSVPAAGTASRNPYRPPVRSPFRPAPRPE